MQSRIAIKKLTASDCTLFESVYKIINAGNQKSINLNADVLTGIFYPSLAAASATTGNEIALAVSIYGPGAKPAHKISRKIIKNTSYKNWRLNGEFISGPTGDTSRYDSIRPGDLAIMAFAGDLLPNSLEMILISQTDPADTALHSVLSMLFSNKSMVPVTSVQLAAAAGAAAVPGSHPVFITAADPDLDSALEDAAYGGIDGVGRLLRNKNSRKISNAEFAKAKVKAEFSGQAGEGLINGYLAARVASGELVSFRWASAENAVAPFDFETLAVTGERTLIDVKTTNGYFENAIHISLSEIIEASGAVTYRIYRVFSLDEDGGNLRVSEDIRPLAQMLKTLHEMHMPAGIRVDGFSISTSIIAWGSEIRINRLDEESL